MARRRSRRFSALRPISQRPFRIPGADLPPLEIPVPSDQDEELQTRYESFQAKYGNMSLLEFIVFEYLLFKRRLVPGIDFIFQAPFVGGRTHFGGLVADFYFPMRQEIWQPQGLRWHTQTPDQRARLGVEEVIFTAQGFKVIYLWEDDLLTRADYVLDAAWFRSAQVSSKLIV